MSPNLDYIKKIDALPGLQSLPDASVDLLLLDPPWPMARAGGTTTRFEDWFDDDKFQESEIDYADFNKRFTAELLEAKRVLKKGRYAILFSNERWRDEYKSTWKRILDHRREWIWDKGRALGLGYYGRVGHLYMLFATKGETRRYIKKQSTVLRAERVVHAAYPTQKPVRLAVRLITLTTKKGEILLDPYFGSGTFLVAAKALGRHYIGFDRSDRAHKLAKERIDKLEKQEVLDV